MNKEYIKNNLLTVTGGLNNWEVKNLNETPEELFLIYYNTTPTICECGNATQFLNFKKGYRPFCSIQCVNKSKLTRNKIKQTKLEKYGDENFNNKY